MCDEAGQADHFDRLRVPTRISLCESICEACELGCVDSIAM